MFFYIGKVIVESSFVSDYISKQINNQIANELGLNVEFEELQLGFFPPVISMNDLTAKDFQNNVTITLGKVEARFGFSLDLITRGKVKQILLSQGEVIVNANFEEKISEDGKDDQINLKQLFEEKYLPVGLELERRIGSVGAESVYVQVNNYEAMVNRLELNPQKESVTLNASVSGFTFDQADLLVDIGSVDSLSINATWKGSEIDIAYLDVMQSLNAYRVAGTITQQDSGWDYDLEGKFRGDLELIKSFHPEKEKIPEIRGYADFAFRAVDKSGTPFIQVNGLIGNLESPYVHIDELTLSGHYDGSAIEVESVSAKQNGGEVELVEPLKIEIDEGVFFKEARIRLKEMHTNDILYFLREDLDILKARITGEASVSLDREENIRIKALSGVKVQGVNLVDGNTYILQTPPITAKDLSVDIIGTSVLIKANLLGERGSLISASGEILGSDIRFKAESKDLNLLDIGPIVGQQIEGVGKINIEIYGSGKDVYFDVKSDFEKQKAFGLLLGELKTQLRLDLGNEKLHIRSGTGQVGDTKYQGRGTFSFAEQSRLDLRVNVEKGNYLDLRKVMGDLMSDFPDPEDFDATFSTRVRVDLDDNEEVRVTGEVSASDLAYYGEEFGRAVGRFEIGSEKISIEDLAVSKGRGKVTGLYTQNLKTGYLEYDFKMGGFRLSDFRFYRMSKMTLDALVEGSFFGSGLLRDFDSINTIELKSSKIGNRPISNSSLSVLTRGNTAKVSTKFLGSTLVGEGLYNYKSGDAKFDIKVNDQDVRRAFALLSEHNLNSSELRGAIEATLVGDFNINSPESFNLLAKINKFDVRIGGKESKIVQERNQFSINKGEVSEQKLELTGSLAQALLSGRGKINERLFIRHRGELSAEALGLLTPKILRPVGKIKSSGVLRRGRSGKLDFFGKLYTENLGFSLEGVPGTLSQGNADISIDSDRLTINRLTANYGEGTVKADGSIIFAVPYPLVNINYDIKNTRVGFLKNSYVIADAEGSLSGQEPPYLLRSRVRIEYGEFAETLAEIISMFKRESSYGKYLPLKVELSADRLIQQDVRVDVVRYVAVRNNLSDIYLTGGANLTGALTSPTVQGVIRVLPGQSKILFKGQEFIVEEGVVRIDGDSRQPPDLRFIANTTVKDYRIRMELIGSTNNLNVSFSSEPSLSPEDIISLLTVGVTSDVSEGLSEKDRQSTTIYGVGSFLVDQFRINEELKNSLGVRLSVTPEFSQDSENLLSGKAAVSSGATSQVKSATKVKIEKKVSDKVDISLSSTVGGNLDEKQEMNINYSLDNNWSLEGVYEIKSTVEDTTQTENSFGFDLKFRKTFK